MRRSHVFAAALLSTLATGGVGCSKDRTSSAAATSGAQAAAASTGCVDKLTSLNPKASGDEKKAYADACSSISSRAQTCIGSAKEQKEVDACLTDKADKDAFMGTLLLAAFKTGAGASGAPASGGAASGAMHTTKLDKLGIQIDAPGEAMVSDGILPKSFMVIDAAVGGLTVSEAGSTTAKTLKAAKSEAQMFKPRNVQGEQTADGYWLTFENTGSLGTNYWVKTVRHIGKKTYTCDGSPDTADKSAAALAACKTLRPI
jgi:hypothetical protein